MTTDRFAADGYAMVPNILTDTACERLCNAFVEPDRSGAGSRTLLSTPWCGELAGQLLGHPRLMALLPPHYVAAQCTYFEKSAARNWLVPFHQDLSIPVIARVDDPALQCWSEKEGGLYVQPPDQVLATLVAVRLHLDDCGRDNGPLRVIAGSHTLGRLAPGEVAGLGPSRDETVCMAARGSVLVMRPLLLHASSKSMQASPRRVLHFLFGPPRLPYGLRWPEQASSVLAI